MTSIPKRSPRLAPTAGAGRRQGVGSVSRDALMARARRKFLRLFPNGFRDETYVAWERDYKWEAHRRWEEQLDRVTHRALIAEGRFAEAASRAVGIEARTNLLFSFEKMALRDAVRSPAGARAFAVGLYDFLYGPNDRSTFESWVRTVGA